MTDTALKYVSELPLDSIEDRVSILYGQSGTGKTTLIYDIMYQLRDKIGTIFAISPSEAENGNFSEPRNGGRVPPVCIHSELSEALVTKIVQQCEVKTTYWKQSMDRRTLKEIMRYIPGATEKVTRALTKLRATCPDIKSEQERAAEIKIMRQFMKSNTSFLKRKLHPKRDKELIIALNYQDLNPKTMLIIDDSTEDLKLFVKSKIFNTLLTRSRHFFLTVLVCCHSDTMIGADVRRITPASFFTEGKTAQSFLGKASNGIPAGVEKEFRHQSRKIFDRKKFNKVLWDGSTVYIYEPKLHDSFDMGSDALWEYNNRVVKKENKSSLDMISDDNPFKYKFANI